MNLFRPSTWFRRPLANRDPISGLVGQAKNLKNLVSTLNRWREQYNPLRSLTIERAVQLLEQGERGEFADLQWVFRLVEKRDAVLRAVIKRRLAAIKKLDWEIKIVAELPEGANQAQAEAQQKTLRAAYEAIDNLNEAIGHLSRAEFRGYAHLNKHRNTDGDVTHLEPLDQWNFIRDGLYGDWFWNPSGESVSIQSANITRIDPELLARDFIVRVEDMPIDEIALIIYLRKNLSQKDWDAFIEIYGIPSGIVIMPPNIPNGREEDYEESATQIAEGGGGALPNGSDYKPNDQPRGTNPFKEHLDQQNSDLVIAGTSGKLTMLNDATGMGSGQSESHQDTFDQLAEAEALEISELFQRHFDAEQLAEHHPDEPTLAYFELCAQTEEDVTEIVDHAQKLSAAGYQIAPKQLAEKTGYEIEVKVEAEARPANGSGQDAEKGDAEKKDGALLNRANILSNNRLAAAFADDLQPLRKRLEAILQIEDPEILRSRLAAFNNQIPQLLKDINADPSAAVILEEEMQNALARGLVGERPVANRDSGPVPPITINVQPPAPAAAAMQPINLQVSFPKPGTRRINEINNPDGSRSFAVEEIKEEEKANG
jgi:phage gp29-like protein